MEPEPVLGWRLWRLHGDHLRSWAIDYVWEPGENLARCLARSGRRCPNPPGTDCQCGFWALWSPLSCLRRARNEGNSYPSVVGLINGWGTVALHGKEGFRAERAAIVCLFTDQVSGPFQPRPDHPPFKWWRGLLSMGSVFVPEATIEEHSSQLPSQLGPVAESYGVPVQTLKSALHAGLLGELGVATEAISEVENFL